MCETKKELLNRSSRIPVLNFLHSAPTLGVSCSTSRFPYYVLAVVLCLALRVLPDILNIQYVVILLQVVFQIFMPNPQGNPDIKKHGFTTDRSEPLTAKLTIRIPESMMSKLKSLENYPEFVRQAIQDALDAMEEQEQ
jgi:hypothetical protein